MIGENEKYYQLFRSSEHFIDMTGFLDRVLHHEKTILGPENSGKSTLCSMVRCCLDDNMSFVEMFGEEVVSAIDDYTAGFLNRYPVISIDFSDFAAESYEEAFQYLRKKMSDLYYGFRDYLLDPENEWVSSREYNLNIMDGTVSDDDLKYSLKHILSSFNRYENKYHETVRAVLILEELNRLKIVAKCYHYSSEMDIFLKEYMCFDAYDDTFCFLETGYEPYDKALLGISYYGIISKVCEVDCLKQVCKLNGVPVYNWDKRGRSGFLYHGYDRGISVDQVIGILQHRNNPDYTIDEFRRQFLKEKRKAIEVEKEEKRRQEEEHDTAQRARYKQGLPDGVILPSVYAGIRTFPLLSENEVYHEREMLLKELFRKHGSNAEQRAIFQDMHCISDSVPSDWNEKYYDMLHKANEKYCDRWDNVSTDGGDHHWIYVRANPKLDENTKHSLEFVKVYVSVPDNRTVSELFIGAVGKLLCHAINTFHAKVSKWMRRDVMCFWISAHDYMILKQYFKEHNSEICRKLPFIAYDSNLGIGREMASWDSQSGIQSRLLCSYFSMKERFEDTSLNEMYSLLVQGWNGDLPDEHPMTKEFKKETAQILLVLLESIRTIIEDKDMNSNNLLLSDDKGLWDILCSSYNWADVGDMYLSSNTNL